LSTEQERTNKALMASVAKAFKEGDLRPLFEAIDDSIVWTSTSPVEFFRFGGVHFNRAGVTELSAQIFSTYHFRAFTPISIVAEGETVWGHFNMEMIHLPSGRVAKSEIAIRWVVRNKKVVEHQGFFDTATMLMHQRELSAPEAAEAGKSRA
jgi:ketosteroid isomerase-like protein